METIEILLKLTKISGNLQLLQGQSCTVSLFFLVYLDIVKDF